MRRATALALVALLAGAASPSLACEGKLIPLQSFLPKPGVFYFQPSGGGTFVATGECVRLRKADIDRYSRVVVFTTHSLPDAPADSYLNFQYVKTMRDPQAIKLRVRRNDGWFLPDEGGRMTGAGELPDRPVRVSLAEWNEAFAGRRTPAEFNSALDHPWVAYLTQEASETSADDESFWRFDEADDASRQVVSNVSVKFQPKAGAGYSYVRVLAIDIQSAVESVWIETESNVGQLTGKKLEIRFEDF